MFHVYAVEVKRPGHTGATAARSLTRAVLLCVLGVCVLCWGTAYKCSLYKSLQEQARTPVAKLDTRGSDAARVQVDDSLQPEAEPVPLQTMLFAPVPTPAPVVVRAVEPQLRPLVEGTPALFFRPPPADFFAST